MTRPYSRELLQSLEAASSQEQALVLCFLAGRSVELDAEELNGAIRRAQLLLASGGDPRREPELHGRATTAVARDLETPARRAQLRAALEGLQAETAGLRDVGSALRRLLADDDLAWQCFALALLAGELSEEP